MKKVVIISFLWVLLVGYSLVNAQTKPEISEIKFLRDGLPVNISTYGNITVQLIFNQDMDTSLDPTVKFGLSDPFPLTVPILGSGWISNVLWQGFFTISDANPETADGEYIFKIYGASNSNGQIDTTLSSDLDQTLFICRTGELNLSAASLNFGIIKAGNEKILNVTIFNESCAALAVSNVTLPAPFSLVSNPSFFEIAGNSSRQLAIKFSPTSRGVFSGNLTITSNDRNQSTHSVQLTGTARGPQIALTPPSTLNFGKLEVGSSLTKTVTIKNEKSEDASLSDTLNVTNIVTSDPVYRVSATELVLPPDSSEIIAVTFAPNNAQLYNGHILTVFSDDVTQSLRTIVLNGDASDEAPPPPLTSVIATWSGYNGYIRGSFLPICWQNPVDNSGIRAIWWYFSTTPLDPLTDDEPDTTQKTTSVGGRIALALNGNCAQLPLFGRISSGFWYCYLWLEDGNGNRSWRNALPATFVYDVNAPLKPVIKSRSILATRWFGFGSPFNLTIEIPVDAARNRRDAAEVFWKFQTPPASASDFSGKLVFPEGDQLNRTFTIPFNSDNLCGDDSLYVWLADSAGNVNHENYTIVPYRYDVCPPVIKRTRSDTENIAKLGQVFRDTLKITDKGIGFLNVDSSWVYYRFGGTDAEEPRRSLKRLTDTTFVVEIPLAGVTRRGIEYRVTALDSIVGNTGLGPISTSYCGEFDDHIEEEEFWFPVRARVEGQGDFRIDADGRPVPLIAGEDSTNYQLISVPYDLDSSAVENVLADDLGDYDNTQWRLFDYKTDNPEATRFLEGEDARPFAPGRSYFLITRKSDIVVDSGPGNSRRTVCNDTLRVYAGWNLIATPFNFPIHKESMYLLNSNSTISLRSLERGWNIVDVMEPWKGYALYVAAPGEPSEDPIKLVIRPKAAQGRLSKAAAGYLALQPGEWLVQISGSAGPALDLENWAGVRSGALEAFDDYDLAEPPVIGHFLRVQFPKPEWNQPARGFSADVRPTGSNEQVWELEVQTNLPETLVKLDVSFLGDFPAVAEVFVVDEGLKIAQNLRANLSYSFKSGKQGSEKKLRLIVGSLEFARAAAGEVPLTPAEFDLLQNYPNPFNPETTIRYNLPAASAVTLEVFDVLGRKVRTLVNADHLNAGYHTAVWDGRDERGRQAASGVYIYRIVSDKQSLSRKMILIK